MAFFSKKPGDAPAGGEAPAQDMPAASIQTAPLQTAPIQTASIQTAPVPPATPDIPPVVLDPQTEDILKKAGEDARKALLKEKDDTTAAE
jgi:hypothetical protein